MIIKEFIENLPDDLKPHAAHIRAKAKDTGIMKEPVAELGNDIWLAQELNINRLRVEEISKPKLQRL